MVSLVVVNDGQKDPKLLGYCFKALSRNDLTNVQVIMLQQAADGAYARKLAAEQPFDIEIFESTGEIVDGIRMWDVMADLKAMQPIMKGPFLLYIHKEFILPPDFFAKCVPWLDDNEPDLAHANLMRVGLRENIIRPLNSSCKKESAKLKRAITKGRMAECLKTLDVLPWIFKREVPVGQWAEDAFFAKLDWLDRMRFFDHADRLLFNDIFDYVTILNNHVTLQVERAPSRIYHLWHQKEYQHFSEKVLEWFESDRLRWRGTYFGEPVTMRHLNDYLRGNKAEVPANPMIAFRQGKKGTIGRWADGFREWYGITEKPAAVSMRRGNPLFFVSPREWRDKNGPTHAVYNAVRKQYPHTQVLTIRPDARPSALPSFAVIWNGGKLYRASVMKSMKKQKIPVLVMEHGWLDRDNHIQLDWQGYNHKASWASRIARISPPEGVERFQTIEGTIGPRKPVEARTDGYILVLGQTEGDTQLNESEIRKPNVLLATVLNSTREKVAFRPHPANGYRPTGVDVLDGSLSEALAGARFVVTINSNSGNDALWAGVPVLCFGPSLYEMAGAAMGTSSTRVENDIELMLNGWCPDDRRVLSYFHWLCARQWTNEELEQGDVIARLIGKICP
tara:strand:- start:3152 stop:5011 length:1860 start_codon:yes stop_codon:yes gene_type:complete